MIKYLLVCRVSMDLKIFKKASDMEDKLNKN